MKRQLIDLNSLQNTEMVQDQARVEAISAYLDGDDMEWDDQPALIVSEDGQIVDGHHRVAACRLKGITRWPAIVVTDINWDAVNHNHTSYCRNVCDNAEDWVTWGHYVN